MPSPSATASGSDLRGGGAPGATPIPLTDRGIYPDLAEKVRVAVPAWLPRERLEVVASESLHLSFLYFSGRAVGFAPYGSIASLRQPVLEAHDADRDGIPDPLDLLIGAKKVALAAAPYVETYRQLAYPNGDLPRSEGVCTDVIVRALRNAGFDLQRLVHEDAASSPASYPAIRRPDVSIDHRRVRNLVVYFERHWDRLSPDPRDGSSPWLPGDIVFLDTMRDPRPDHVGVVSDQTGPSGLPLLINSWTSGYVASEMDLLGFVPVTHRYRVPLFRRADFGLRVDSD